MGTLRLHIARAVALTVLLLVLAPHVARADDVAEASAAFESGNAHFQRAQRLHGDRRMDELDAALAEYFASLRIIRSRNVLYNTAIVLEQMQRWDECFNYWTEYLGVTGLSDEERADGTQHQGAARTHVAVLSITSTPSGADVWIDRRDLATRGHTPLEIAVEAGDHHLYLAAPGHRETEATASARTGETASVSVTLTAAPVSLQVLAPETGHLTLDDAPIRAGSSTDVTPGSHLLRLEVPGADLVERHFEVLAGAAPMVIDLTSAVHASVVTTIPLAIHADADVEVLVDGAPRTRGSDVVVGVTPGEHDVRLEADGHAPVMVRGSFDGAHRIDAHLAPVTDGGVMAARGILATAALVGLGLSIGFSVDAASQQSTFMAGRPPPPAQADAVDAANLRADVSWAITLALGVGAVVSLFVDAGGGTSEAHIVLAPSPDGATLAAVGRFGGL